MSTYTITIRQDLSGWYQGDIDIEANSKEEAIEKVKGLSNNEIDDMVHWEHGDEYFGDIDSIEIDFDSIFLKDIYENRRIQG